MEIVNNRVAFQILGVNTEAEIMMLKKCFIPYAKCSVCSIPQEERATTIFKGSHSSLGRCVACTYFKLSVKTVKNVFIDKVNIITS
jgi:Zn ribbon nucleic-acid-binding protein